LSFFFFWSFPSSSTVDTPAPLVSSPITTVDPTVPELLASSFFNVPVAPQPRQAPALPIHPMLTRAKDRQLSLSFPYALVSSLEHNSIQEALLDLKWTNAMEEEYSKLIRNKTWELVPFFEEMNLIGC